MSAGDLLAFRAGGERFAVPLDRVREAARPRRITPLPGAPVWWSGVALVRGEALGIVDVAAAVGLPPSPPRPLPLVVVLHGCDHALLVDTIDGVEPFPAGHVAPPPPGSRSASRSCRGRRGLSLPARRRPFRGEGRDMIDEQKTPLAARAADPDSSERWSAALALAKVPGEEAEDLLVGLLKDEDYRVRERAVASLGRRFNARVASACAVALADDADAGHRAAGLVLLAKGGAAGRAVLLGALQHPSADVRISAATALPGPSPGAETVSAIEAAARREGDPNARAALLLALGRTGRREAISPLLAVLEEGNLWLQIHALEALGSVGDPEIAPRLLPLLGNDSLRQGALHALARLSSPIAAEPLIRRAAAGELDPFLLAAARAALEASPASTLASLRPLWPDAREALLTLLEDPEEDGPARTDAAHLMVLLDVPGAALAVVTHGPFRDGYAALRSLARTRCEEALLAVLQVADPEPALELLDALRGGPDAPTLLPLLVHHSPTVKAAVLSCVPAGLVPVSDLIDVLAEDDPETALAAALALACDETGAPLDQLRTRRRALLDRAGGPDGPGRTAALTALATADGADVEAAIRGALVSPDPAVREAAVSAGAQGRRLGDHELVARLSDESPTVRAAALRGLALRANRGSTRRRASPGETPSYSSSTTRPQQPPPGPPS